MNVYVVYKFDNGDIVEKTIKEIKNKLDDQISFFYFPKGSSNPFWRITAKKKLKNCDMVAFFDLFDGDLTSNAKNLKWELDCAEKNKKKIVVIKKNKGSYHSKIYDKDYSGIGINKRRYSDPVFLEEVVDFFKKQAGWCVRDNLLHIENSKNKCNDKEKKAASEKNPRDIVKQNFEAITHEEKALLLEQYRIMIETSEKLMERRQSVGSLYTTICTALVAFTGAALGFDEVLVSAASAFMSGLIIIFLCSNWKASLTAYDLNNAGKFEVINQIEKYLPADMFECEYKYNSIKGIKSFSAREKKLPTIFSWFGVLSIIAAIVLFLVHYVF
jgi:hypothetical protein